MCTVLMATMTFTSCSQNEPENSGDFIIAVSNITQTSADYIIEPKDPESTYAVVIFNNRDISDKTDDNVRAEMKNAFDVLIKNVPEITGYDYFLRTGTSKGKVTDIQPGTTTSIVVSKMDAEGNFSGRLSRIVFQTLE